MATLEDRLAALAAAIGTSVRTKLATKADDNAVVHRTGAETVNGVKTFGSAPVVPTPGAAANPVRNDDARLSDARAPTAHTHGADQVTAAPRTIAYGAALTGLAPAAGVALDVVTCTLTGNPTITPAAGTDRQVVRLAMLAGGSSRTVTFAAAVKLGTGIADRTLAIGSGQVGVVGLEYFSGLSAWVLFSEWVSS